MSEQLETLALALYREISAGRYREAQRISEQCSALHTFQTHHDVIGILDRARRLAMAQRSMCESRMAVVQTANQYLVPEDSGRHTTVTG